MAVMGPPPSPAQAQTSPTVDGRPWRRRRVGDRDVRRRTHDPAPPARYGVPRRFDAAGPATGTRATRRRGLTISLNQIRAAPTAPRPSRDAQARSRDSAAYAPGGRRASHCRAGDGRPAPMLTASKAPTTQAADPRPTRSMPSPGPAAGASWRDELLLLASSTAMRIVDARCGGLSRRWRRWRRLPSAVAKCCTGQARPFRRRVLVFHHQEEEGSPRRTAAQLVGLPCMADVIFIVAAACLRPGQH